MITSVQSGWNDRPPQPKKKEMEYMNSLVRALTSDLDYFNSLFQTAGSPARSGWGSYYSWLPPANVSESEKGYAIELEAPGLSRDSFEISAEDGRLTIAVHEGEAPATREKYVSQEFGFTRGFKRSWTLPSSVEASGISARYEAGILHVEVPAAKKKSRVAVRVD